MSLSKAAVVEGAVSGPEAPLPVVVGRHLIRSCNLFVALQGAHLTTVLRYTILGARAGIF